MKRTHDTNDAGPSAAASKRPNHSSTTTTNASPPLSTLAFPPPTTLATTHPPAFQQPLPLLTFSYTPAHVLEFSDAAMRYFVDPPRGADLNYGYERWVRRPDERGRLDSLLRAYARVRERPPAEAGSVDAGVVCWRGVMTK